MILKQALYSVLSKVFRQKNTLSKSCERMQVMDYTTIAFILFQSVINDDTLQIHNRHLHLEKNVSQNVNMS